MKTAAVISKCGTYRYLLTREWDSTKPTCVFIMLNPSTADATEDDPTIRRCIGYARREGCGSLKVVNIMAFRATNPRNLPKDHKALGPKNSEYLHRVTEQADGPIIAAWGGNKAATRYVPNLLKAFEARGIKLQCLKKTKDGSPGHPLYVRCDAPLMDL